MKSGKEVTAGTPKARPNKDIIVTRTNDYRPQSNGKYFQLTNTSYECITVVIPFYNEERFELFKTLESLYHCYNFLSTVKTEWVKKPLKIFIIQDGWYKASESAKEYLINLFYNNNVKWWLNDDFIIQPDEHVTYVFESKSDLLVNENEVLKYNNTPIYQDITLMIKIDNRKKHNSHEWYCGGQGFAEVMNSKYMLFTDAFTIFNKACLWHLVDFLDKNPKYSVCTGRQRVMTKELQHSKERCFSEGYFLRKVQSFDFESTNSLYNGAFSLGGTLPVIPGPCGLYRANDILQDKVRDWYFDTVNKEPSETGLVLGNLKIAEDRILSLASILKTKEERYMGFVSLAVFYFEAETSLRKFILQRRRWINGAFAGYIYLLITNPQHIFNWETSNKIRKIYIIILLFFQLISYVVMSVSPAITILTFEISSKYLWEQFSPHNFNNNTILILKYSICGLFLIHWITHHFNKFNSCLIYFLVIICSFLSYIPMTGCGVYLLIAIKDGAPFYIWLFFLLFFLVFIMLFINGSLISNRFGSTKYMIKSWWIYYGFLPMITCGFAAYSYARFWDLSWGNRPDSKNDISHLKYKARFLRRSRQILIVIILLNAGLIYLGVQPTLWISLVIFSVLCIQLTLSFVYGIMLTPSKFNYFKTYIRWKTLIDIKNKEQPSNEFDTQKRVHNMVSIDIQSKAESFNNKMKLRTPRAGDDIIPPQKNEM